MAVADAVARVSKAAEAIPFEELHGSSRGGLEMMLHYVVQHISKVPPVQVDEAEGVDLECATVVLQHSDGPVGFERSSGSEAIKALVDDDVVVIEAANSPGWVTMNKGLVSSQSLHFTFRRVLTCTRPHEELLRELETVSSNKKLRKKNEVLVRHGKPPLTLTPTIFDPWILPGGRICWKPLIHLVDFCRSVAIWSLADWGLYAMLLGRSSDSAVGPVLRAGQELGVPVRRVLSETELPTW